MIDLLKKDFIVSIKGEGIRNIKYVLIFLLMYFLFNSQSYYITPMFISYLIVADTFYNDYKGKNMNYINSMPISKEDIVYSKYILAIITIIIITSICGILNFLLEPVFHRSMVLNDIYYSITIFIAVISITLLLYFKFGYHKIRTLAGTISIIIFFIVLIPMSAITDIVHHAKTIGIDQGISFVGPFSSIFNYISNKPELINISRFIIFILVWLIFIISMYISLKIINEKYNKINYIKFFKISIIIIVITIIFNLLSNIIFSDLKHEYDYLENNDTEVGFELDSRYEDEKGINLKFEINNPTKYTFKLEDAYLNFDMYENGNKEIISNSSIKIETQYPFEESDSNWNIYHKGIKPKCNGYLVFTVPKGLKLDSNNFALDSIGYDIKGQFVVDIPFIDGGYITIRPEFNMGGSKSEVYLQELDIEKK